MARRLIHSGVIYGPVRSRRFGMSLGINLSGPGKYCSFDCVYCFRGPNDGRPDEPAFRAALPSPQQVIAQLSTRLTGHPNAHVDDWTLAGNAEPTDHPGFPEIVDALLDLRRRLSSRVSITVLTNGMGLIPRVNPRAAAIADALGRVDRPCLKLDAGTDDTWRRLARPAFGVTLPEWLAAAERLHSPVIQTMLLRGRIDNTTEPELAALCNAYERLSPREVHLLTLNKPTSRGGVDPVTNRNLRSIRNLVSGVVACRSYSCARAIAPEILE